MARIRQTVLAARDLDRTRARLGEQLSLGEPFADPAVGYFGLENLVWAIGDTFLEVVSPVQDETAAGRLLDRRDAQECGYMVMFQVDDLDAARERAAAAGVREVFDVDFDEIREVHLHPADMRGAIVSLSEPDPSESWKWGGPGWERRSAAGSIAGITVAVADPAAAAERWSAIVGNLPEGVEFISDPSEPGLTSIKVAGDGVHAEVAPAP
jgi:hypothetical protein